MSIAVWIEPYLIAQPEDRFSCNEAHNISWTYLLNAPDNADVYYKILFSTHENYNSVLNISNEPGHDKTNKKALWPWVTLLRMTVYKGKGKHSTSITSYEF